MTRTFSAYLDSIRFLAAMVVFLGHASGRAWTGSFLWPLGAYGDTCVIVFFVLSGFVIAYVCDVKEREWQIYYGNRIARLWSVVLPALVLTFLIDYFGVRVAPQLYLGQAWYSGDHLPFRYLASIFMLQEVWHAKFVPGINQPLWSLSYEAIYYLTIGCALFVRNWLKWPLVIVSLLIGGPLIAALFPIWLLGYISYFLSKSYRTPTPVAAILFISSAIALSLSPTLRHLLPVDWYVLGERVLSRYIDAIAFFINLLAAHSLMQRYEISHTLQRLIASIASATFALYVFHRPLIQFFSYIGPVDASSPLRRILVIGGTLVIVFILTPITEIFRQILRKKLVEIFYEFKAFRLFPAKE